MNKKRKILLWLGLVAVLVGGAFFLGHTLFPQTVEVEKPYPVTVEKPVPVHDTVYTTKTVYLPKVVTKHDTVENSVTTTVYVHDTVQVQVPISRLTFEETINEANVKAVVSGFEPCLESLTVTNLKTCPTQRRRLEAGRIGLGIQVGYGMTFKDSNDGWIQGRPYVGVGINYNFISF